MKRIIHHLRICLIVIFVSVIYIACGRSSSPEGRMTLKFEELQKQMLDSLQLQNNMIRDSLSAIRKELNEIKQQNN